MWSRVCVLVALAAAAQAAPSEEAGADRQGKILFPVIQIVTFENSPCTADNNEAGTCYSSSECSSLGGVASGKCGNNFGVCCVLSATCDATITTSGTYFTSPNYPAAYSSAGACVATLVPPEGTCQILLEFVDFDLLGPTEGDCVNDTFVVSGANAGSSIPVLCGSNAGQHIYIDVDQSEGPYSLAATLSSFPVDRQWKIKVTYLAIDDTRKAPFRCLQYYDETEGSIESFNFQGTDSHILNDLGYSVCFGYVPGYCDVGLNFDRFDLGRVSGTCTGDYLGISGQDNLCGDLVNYSTTANATGPITSLYVNTDSNNDREEEGFALDYMMMAC